MPHASGPDTLMACCLLPKVCVKGLRLRWRPGAVLGAVDTQYSPANLALLHEVIRGPRILPTIALSPLQPQSS